MNVGDLVKIKYDGAMALVERIETVHVGCGPVTWFYLLGIDPGFRRFHLEAISESR